MTYERRGSGVAAQALLREAEILGRCRHPGIVELRTAAVDGDQVTVVTDLPPGAPLGDATLTVQEVAGVVAVLATTISDLHSIGVAHLRVDASAVHLGSDGRPILDRFDGATFLDGPARRWPVHRLAGEDDRALGELFRALLSGSVGPTVRLAPGSAPSTPWRRATAGLAGRRAGGPRRGGVTSLVVWAARTARGEVTARQLAEAMADGVIGARLPVLDAHGRADAASAPPGELSHLEPEATAVDQQRSGPNWSPAPFSDEAIDAWLLSSPSVAQPADRILEHNGVEGPPVHRAHAIPDHDGFERPPVEPTGGGRPRDIGTDEEAWTEATAAAWAPFAPVAPLETWTGLEGPDRRWPVVEAPRRRLLDNPGRLAAALAAAAVVIVLAIVIGSSSKGPRADAGHGHPTIGSGAPSSALGAPHPAGANAAPSTSGPPLAVAPGPTAGAPLSLPHPTSPSNPRPTLQYCITAPSGTPTCTVGTYAQGVLRLGTNHFVVGRKGDVAAIGHWACGPSTLALLRPGLVAEVWVFPAWPESVGVPLAGSLVGTVPGGQTLAPLPEGACDALAVGRGNGTTVDLGPLSPVESS